MSTFRKKSSNYYEQNGIVVVVITASTENTVLLTSTNEIHITVYRFTPTKRKEYHVFNV